MALVAGVPAALQRLSALGVWTVGLVGEARQALYELPLGDQPVALVLGSEGSGLADLTRRRCDALASHPPARLAVLAQRVHRRGHRLLRRGPPTVGAHRLSCAGPIHGVVATSHRAQAPAGMRTSCCPRVHRTGSHQVAPGSREPLLQPGGRSSILLEFHRPRAHPGAPRAHHAAPRAHPGAPRRTAPHREGGLSAAQTASTVTPFQKATRSVISLAASFGLRVEPGGVLVAGSVHHDRAVAGLALPGARRVGAARLEVLVACTSSGRGSSGCPPRSPCGRSRPAPSRSMSLVSSWPVQPRNRSGVPLFPGRGAASNRGSDGIRTQEAD